MKSIHELIQKLCPNGVSYKKLGDLGVFENIGVDKKIIEGQPLVKLLNYVDVYKNIYIDNDIPQMIVSASPKKIDGCSCEKGDIFITPTSETRDDIGHASVIIEPLVNTVYSYHIMRFRLFELNMTTSFFIRYLLETEIVQKQIYKLAKGLTRFGLSKYDFAKIEIPFPPRLVQEEIVRILDKFTNLAAELQAELQARQEQYEHYRDKLLNFSNINGGGYASVTWMKMSEIGTFIRGNGLQKKDFTESGVPCIHYGQIYTYYGTFAMKTKSFVKNETARKCKKAHTNDLIFATVSENIEDVCKCVAWLGDEEICISGDSLAFSHNQNPKYLAYYFQTTAFSDYKRTKVTGTKVIRLHQSKLEEFAIPIPPLAEQNRIVSILDKFEALVSDLSQGLPAEIAAVQEQYEYYRNRLLSFPKIAA
ncbi:MAG: restriction endonuclease subunit S [Bacteroides sp.]|nr:restriction endonuclease subunit S [Ruminococcus flavefaciens]MCM1555197.1 restriction endonuclease subunit S [Bacteroides sp.]